MVLAGLVVGFAVGVALVAGFHYVMHCRNRTRLQQVTGIHLLSTLQEDGLKKLCGNSYPTGISFLTFEKVNWLNAILHRAWPYIVQVMTQSQDLFVAFVQATEPLVKEILGPILEQYRPAGIASLKMDQFHIGKVPPLIDGIRMQSLQRSQVIMDMDFKWGGDASIVLAINPVVGPKLPVQLKNFSLFATIRVMLQLSEEVPCISALVVALLAKILKSTPDASIIAKWTSLKEICHLPSINYDQVEIAWTFMPKFQIKYNLKVIGGSTGVIPGLGDMIQDLVESSVSDQLEWPHRIVVPIGSTPADVMSDLGLKLQGKLRVTVIRCTGLKNMEKVGMSDPYVRLYVRVLFKSKTEVIENNLNPMWNKTFDFDVEDTETQTLVMQVKDRDVGTDKLLGVTTISLHDLKPDVEEEFMKKLSKSLDTDRVKDKGDRGTISVKLRFHPYTKQEQEKAMEDERKFLQAKEDLKNAGVIGGAMDAIGGGAKLVTAGIETVGSGIGAGVGAVGSGVGLVGSGLGKAGKLMSSGVKRLSSNKLISSASSPASGSPLHENGAGRF